MTLHAFALNAIVLTMRREYKDGPQALNDARVAAWLVWSMRKKILEPADRKDYNHARRVLQRAGRVKV